MIKPVVIAFMVVLTSPVFGQILTLEDLHYRNHLDKNAFDKNQQFHSSIKPLVSSKVFYSESKSYFGFQYNFQGTNRYKRQQESQRLKAFSPSADKLVSSIAGVARFRLYPLLDLGIGFDDINALTYDAGVGLAVDYTSKKWLLTAKFLPYYSKPNFIVDSIQQHHFVSLGTGRALSTNTYFRGELIGVFKANEFFTFLGGYGKNTFGEGYRSLLLSDHAAANPFLKVETSFSSFKYVNLFNVWNDFKSNPTHTDQDITKLSAMHYLSWNIVKSFNLSLFETVVWQAKDSLTSRFFEPNYMNPFVFYRPVEYAQGSADNVLVGLNMSYKPNAKSTWYYQLVLDEFLLSKLKARNGWWGNKYGMQIGVKSADFLWPNLYAQAEFNFVRPFTYSHKRSPQVYGHANSSVTHPLGANFYELNAVLSYQKGQHRLTSQFVYAGFGSDTSMVSYGQDIFASYSNRDGEDNHLMMQGEKHNVFSMNMIYEYELKHLKKVFLTGKYRLRTDRVGGNSILNHTVELGIRSRIWNVFDDI